MKKTLFSLLLVIILLFCSCTVKVNDDKAKNNTTKGNTTTQTTDNTTTSEVETTGVRTFYTKEIKEDSSDPYSSLIKNKCNDIVRYWEGGIEQDKKFGFDYYIRNFDDLYYFLYDLDKDGTNELLLGTLQRVGIDYEDITAPEKICITSIYTIKNGKAVKVDNGILTVYYIIIIDRILYSNGVIVTEWGKEKKPCYSAAALENGEMKMKSYVLYGDTGLDGDFLKVVNFDGMDTVKITNNEYYSLYNKYIGDAKAVDIDWKRIDEYSVK